MQFRGPREKGLNADEDGRRPALDFEESNDDDDDDDGSQREGSKAVDESGKFRLERLEA